MPMKFKLLITCLLAIILTFLTPLHVFAQGFKYGSISNESEMATEIIEILNRYSPTTKYALDKNVSESGTSAHSIALEHVSGAEFKDLFYYLSTVAHYRAHNWHSGEVMTMSTNRGQIMQRYDSNTKHFINTSEIVDLSFQKFGIISTDRAVQNMPTSLRTFRFNTYVGPGTDEMSANSFGAYGLLKEFDAYYKGLRAVVDSEPYFIGYFDKDFSMEFILGYFGALRSDILGTYEFLFWTLEYMLYLQNNHPEQYRELINDKNYMKAFAYFYEKSIFLIEVEVPTLKRRLFANILAHNYPGIEAQEVDGIFTITQVTDGRIMYTDAISFKPCDESLRIREHLRDSKYVNLLSTLLGDLPNLPSRWAREPIAQTVSVGIVPQKLMSNYRDAITRADFCALAVELFETVSGKEITKRMQFGDTNDINVQKIGGLGIVTGIGDGNFGPNQTISRQQAAVILAGILSELGYRLPNAKPNCADSSAISQWARDSVGQMQALGVMSSVSDNNFVPRGDFTREQSITTMLRIFELF